MVRALTIRRQALWVLVTAQREAATAEGAGKSNGGAIAAMWRHGALALPAFFAF